MARRKIWEEMSLSTSPGGRISKLKQHLTGFRDDEDALMLPIEVIPHPDAFWVPIPEADLFCFCFGNLGGQGNVRPALLDTILVGSDPPDMGGMRHDAPGKMFEF